ncbi:eukaryotic translation initiation factor 3 subunit A [Leptidea sinapis]|uniref:eukaryotic translation initiation factor 3 subunit A n=1 Tax=Leptidea sinapis TaxID=189913 RepID=UPI002128433F|nr:eukaryotic translation initiation factor 3 subunit A [Leptidea sinapis]
MLKFLTHKLRTHSLNEENVSEKVEERDSGTESDDEAERTDTGGYCADVIMKWNDVTNISMSGEACACAPTPPAPRQLVAPEPDQLYDHHSSEEELEVINGSEGSTASAEGGAAPRSEGRRRGASSPARTAPEKRRWPAEPYDEELATRAPSSDDDDTKVETPVRFRTSPPLEALKPRRAGGVCAGGAGVCGASAGGGGGGGPSPPSPRRRRMPLPPPRRHRPALDFDKMQQLKVSGAGGVRSWRAVGGAHGGELSVFCW